MAVRTRSLAGDATVGRSGEDLPIRAHLHGTDGCCPEVVIGAREDREREMLTGSWYVAREWKDEIRQDALCARTADAMPTSTVTTEAILARAR